MKDVNILFLWFLERRLLMIFLQFKCASEYFGSARCKAAFIEDDVYCGKASTETVNYKIVLSIKWLLLMINDRAPVDMTSEVRESCFI